ncbi:hypothetical protein LINGRAHAP2_LOCUS14710 [Linum grandiflorum]
MDYDPNNSRKLWTDQYMRIQVELDVRNPLKRGKIVRLHGDVSILCKFRYERLQTFCYICGIMGHSKKYYSYTVYKPHHTFYYVSHSSPPGSSCPPLFSFSQLMSLRFISMALQHSLEEVAGSYSKKPLHPHHDSDTSDSSDTEAESSNRDLTAFNKGLKPSLPTKPFPSPRRLHLSPIYPRRLHLSPIYPFPFTSPRSILSPSFVQSQFSLPLIPSIICRRWLSQLSLPFEQQLPNRDSMTRNPTPSNYQSSGSSNHIQCKHKHVAVVKVSATRKNPGRRFFRCPFWKDDDCGFFKWSDDGVDCDSSCSTVALDSLKHGNRCGTGGRNAEVVALKEKEAAYQEILSNVEAKCARRKCKILLLKSELRKAVEANKELEVQLRDKLEITFSHLS